MKLDNIEAVLFDSGRVLNFPQTGHWFISPKFYTQIDKAAFEKISTEKRKHAFKTAVNYMDFIKVIKTKEEEYKHFKIFYEIFSKELPELKLDEKNISELTKDLVFNAGKYIF